MLESFIVLGQWLCEHRIVQAYDCGQGALRAEDGFPHAPGEVVGAWSRPVVGGVQRIYGFAFAYSWAVAEGPTSINMAYEFTWLIDFHWYGTPDSLNLSTPVDMALSCQKISSLSFLKCSYLILSHIDYRRSGTISTRGNIIIIIIFWSTTIAQQMIVRYGTSN